MPESFLFPTISSLPAGYDCTVALPAAALAARLVRGTGAVDASYRVYHEGRLESEERALVEYAEGEVRSGPLKPFVWRDAAPNWVGGYLEIAFSARGGAPIFDEKPPVGFYTIYSKPGKKSFFSDNSYKFGAPPVIDQIARYGRFVDGYPVVHLHRGRDLGETITLINPYRKALLASIYSHDGRKLERLRVQPMSARNVRLVELLRPGEVEWFGHVQLTANNRVVAYDVKHSLADPTMISDHEHLDPYRADPTHLPLARAARRRMGEAFKKSA